MEAPKVEHVFDHLRRHPSAAGLSVALAAIATSVAAGAAIRRDRDPFSAHELTELGCMQEFNVIATDGVALSVCEQGPSDAELTVVFSHGFCLRKDAWHFQAADIASWFPHRVRMVFYDQRGHGSSQHSHTDGVSINQLGDDLHSVVEKTVTGGQVILVGHSMGGMSVLNYVHRYREQQPAPVAGVCLVSTAAGGLHDFGLGQVLSSTPVSWLAKSATAAPGVFNRWRGGINWLIGPMVRAASFGDLLATSPTIAKFSEMMIRDTDAETIGRFFAVLREYDHYEHVQSLNDIPTRIVCGTSDMLTAHEHSLDISQLLPHSSLALLPGVGHMSLLERSTDVSLEIAALISSVVGPAHQRLPLPGPRLHSEPTERGE